MVISGIRALGGPLAAAGAVVGVAAAAGMALGAGATTPSYGVKAKTRHALLISVDGLHASDLAAYIAAHPNSTLAKLSRSGTTYTDASTPLPSDSFPGLLALVTGGTPKSTGVYYDDSYDRTLFPPGSNCQGSPGTEVVYDESIDVNPNAVDSGGIDPAKLPMAKQGGACVPLYPHSFLRVNTIFNVAHDAGLATAWSDKHPAYDLVNGPSGNGVDDLFTPEIGPSDGITSSETATQAYDALKVKATLNEINGLDSTGQTHVGTPSIFGMNFQAVSVGQKLPSGGYLKGGTQFSPTLASGLDFVDGSLGSMVTALGARHLRASTEIIITAKHGQSPTDRFQLTRVPPATIPGIVNGVQPDLVAQATQDDVSLVWLRDSSEADAAAAALEADKSGANTAAIDHVIAGKELVRRFGDPASDPRVPDLIVQPRHGVIYTGSAAKIAEHGGGDPEDSHVALLVVKGTTGNAKTISAPVATTQVAPSILDYLALDPHALDAVRAEHTAPLPSPG